MHELSIALAIIDIAGEVAQREGGGAIVAVHLKLGPLAGVVKDALQSAFELAREDTVLADSRLVIEDVPIAAWCQQCQCEREVESLQRLCCRRCGAATQEIVAGRELEVVAMEMET